YCHPNLPRPPNRDMYWFQKDKLRSFRLAGLVGGLEGNQLSEKDLMDILSDHSVNYPTSICQHAEDFATLTSTVCDLNRKIMYVAVGNPCEGYMEVDPFTPQ
ncbi:MAG: hypothetical protein LUE94_09390, partial [Clostridiales bacterium]|nr:hypothetical protein [Clostridiales bacterium]